MESESARTWLFDHTWLTLEKKGSYCLREQVHHCSLPSPLSALQRPKQSPLLGDAWVLCVQTFADSEVEAFLDYVQQKRYSFSFLFPYFRWRVLHQVLFLPMVVRARVELVTEGMGILLHPSFAGGTAPCTCKPVTEMKLQLGYFFLPAPYQIRPKSSQLEIMALRNNLGTCHF